MKVLIFSFVFLLQATPAYSQGIFGGTDFGWAYSDNITEECKIKMGDCDQIETLFSQKLDIQSELKKFATVSASFDQSLADIALKKDWILEARPFLDRCALENYVLLTETAYCQNSYEIRISRAYWARVNNIQKLKILLFNILRIHAEERNAPFLALTYSTEYLRVKMMNGHQLATSLCEELKKDDVTAICPD